MNESSVMTLRLDPASPMLTVESVTDGVIARKNIKKEVLYDCIKSSIAHDPVQSALLPRGCIAFGEAGNEREVVILYQERYADINYYGTCYEHFPLPRLVFAFHCTLNGKVTRRRLGVIQDEQPRPDSVMYYYPFSNVGSSDICTGSNPIPNYKEVRQLGSLPHYILSLPDNDDFFQAERNALNLNHRDLLEHLKDKDPAYYYGHILVPNGHTLQDFIDRRY